MRRRVLKLLGDIQASGTSIQGYVAGMAEGDYLANQAIRRSVERVFEIIGEALRRLSSLDPAVFARIGNARQFIDFGNVLTHGYDVVDDSIVWSTIAKRLPTLLTEVDALTCE